MSILLLPELKAIAQSQPPEPPEQIELPSNLPDVIDRAVPDRPSGSPDTLPEVSPEELPTPNLEPPAIRPAPEASPGADVTFRVQQIDVLGSTVLQDEIAELVANYENRDVTFGELLTLRSQITQLYIEQGYITSGAFLPSNQVLSDGTVQIQVVEGVVERIEVSGLRHLRAGYVRDRLQRATDPPLNQDKLLEALQLLELDPMISQINAELTAGTAPGQNLLLVEVDEPSPFNVTVGGDNHRPPSIGSGQISVGAAYSNLIGVGDRMRGEYGITGGLTIVDAELAVPVNASDGTLRFNFNSSESQIIEDDFEDLDIESKTRSYSLDFRQPIVRSPNTEVALGLGFDLRRRQTFILDDIPFSFSEGPEDGQANATVIRFFQDWVDRGPRRVLAARSQFSLGLDALNATVNDSGTDARFFSWVGQFQWVQQLSSRNLIITRLSTQLSPDSLLSLEQFSIGGVDTVRGYAQNQLVADNGVLGAIEGRIPVTANPQRLQLTPFFEAGTVWNNRTPDPDPATIASVGLGLRLLIGSNLVARLDYGIPLVDVERDANSLQENGLYFSLRYQPF